MVKRIYKDSAPVSQGPHADYAYNLSRARSFCDKVQKSLLAGMAAKITDSDGLKQALLMISFTPPRDAKMGNYAAPIFLHQSRSEVEKQTEAVFSAYMALAKKFWDSQPKMMQPELVKL